MELLIGAGIAGLGWALSKKRPPQGRRRAESTAGAAAVPSGPEGTDILMQRQTQLAQDRWTASRDPRISGVVDRNVPYFRSFASQTTNADLSQRRMEMYTGATSLDASRTGTWRPKVEAGPLFDPTKQAVTSGGSQGNPANYETQRLAASVSNTQQGALPFQQVRVGPGVGVDANTPAADGFHSMFRVMPTDAWGFKRNELEGRINPGSNPIGAREVDPTHYSKSVPRVWDMERRPLERGRAAATGQTIRPETTVKGCHYDTPDEYFGIAGRTGPNVQEGASARFKSDARPGLPLTNVTGARSGIGAFTSENYDRTRFDSQQRETTSVPGAGGGIRGDQYRHQAPSSFVMQNTNREMQTHAYVGGARHYVNTGTTHYVDAPQPTLREQLHDQCVGMSGSVSGTVRGPTVQCTDRQLLKESKRGSQVVNGYVAAAERSDAFRRANGGDDEIVDRCMGRVGLRSDVSMARAPAQGETTRMYHNQAGPGVSSGPSNKLETINRFQDFGLAKRVLATNDLHVPLV